MAEQQAVSNQLKTWKSIKKWEIVIYILVLLLYVAANGYLMFFHEAWRDESQAWVIAKQLSWTQIPEICASEGHPLLWFYILKISILFGLPFRYISVISIFFMALAAGVLLFKSDFKWFTKILIILSPLFFYYNPVICRNYSVIMLLICLLCTLWKDRHEKPLLYAIPVVLLFQSHILISGLAIGCILDMCINLISNKKHRDLKHFGGLLVSAASFSLMFLELRQKPGAEHFITITGDYVYDRIKGFDWLIHLKSVSDMFDYPALKIGSVVLLASVISLLVFMFLSFDPDFRKACGNTGLVYLCATGVYFGITVFVRDISHIQMAIVLIMIILFFCWTLRDYKKGFLFEAVMIVLCVAFIPKSLVIDPYNDIKGHYSESKALAEAVEKNVESGSVIFVNNNFLTTSVIAYLSDSAKNYTFWDADNDEVFYIHRWGSNKQYLDESSIAAYANDTIKKNGLSRNAYFVRGNVIIQPKQEYGSLTLISGCEDENFWKEYYWLYKIKTQTE